ncbi:MAG: hypothetical protein ACHQ50_04980 [Fimbriimonadales bacterium]
MKSLNALRNSALETAKVEAGPVNEMALICADLVLHIESLQRQIDEMKRHDTRRRAGLS